MRYIVVGWRTDMSFRNNDMPEIICGCYSIYEAARRCLKAIDSDGFYMCHVAKLLK